MSWGLVDFLVAGGLITAFGGVFVMGLRASNSWSYRAGFALALLTGLAVIWSALAVGIVGDEGDPADLMYAAILFGGFVAACAVRFSPGGMRRSLYALSTATGAASLAAISVAGNAQAPVMLMFHTVIAGGFAISGYLCGRAAVTPGLAAPPGPR
ncbi:hypothetical protein [Hyphomonas sp.]|uniref:hypothetical protein n=1 Tax=Hyphomonas sp. TaxID=87 RepID=UPI0025C3ED75|nr:hypothetical protein [Hyphomonas sp.]MBI1400740.1 hypothetical protein [Hyphomonas sp.]